MVEVAGLVGGLAGLLALVAVLPPLAARLRLPYTVLLAVVGCGLGVAIGLARSPEMMGPLPPVAFLADTLASIPITADLFLWVFLPLLLFETSLNLNGRDLLDDIGPVLVLAVLAVVFCTVIGGLAVWTVTDVPLLGCLLVAAIIATTDPAAVIAVFREVGAPHRLVALVEGESLLNDAAAIALATALVAVITGAAPAEPAAIVLSFIREFLGGALVGAVLGRLAASLVSRIDRGGPAEVTLSLALAYLAYAIAQAGHVSGVVAVVAAGLVFGTVARTRVGTREWRSVTTIWTQLGFWAGSLIFVMASMLVPATLATATGADILGLAALILGALAARAVALFLVLPAADRLFGSRPVDGRYKKVILWGGLRGAITLALALAVTENDAIAPELQHVVSVLATGFVLFTLLVQGATLGPVIRKLGLDRLDPLERRLRARALEVAHGQVQDELALAAGRQGVSHRPAGGVRAVLARDEADPPAAADDGSIEAELVTALATVTARERQLFVEARSRQLIAPAVSDTALRDASRLLDALKGDGLVGYERTVDKLHRLDRGSRVAALLHRRLGVDGPLAGRLATRIELYLAKRQVLDELLGFARQRLDRIFDGRVPETVALLMERRLQGVDRVLDGLRLQYPQYWGQAVSFYLERMALRLELDRYEAMLDEHILSPQLFGNLAAELRQQLRTVSRTPKLDLGLDLATLVRNVPLFAGLSDDRLAQVCRLLRPRLIFPEERVVRAGEPGEAMFFIATGAVEVALPAGPVRLGTGEFFGEMALLQRRPRVADVVALGYGRMLELRRDAFIRLVQLDPDLLREVERVAAARRSPLDEHGGPELGVAAAA